jgi:hypothetical protein
MATPLGLGNAAYDAGLHDPVALARAIAVALAESGGNERAHNAIPPDDSYGAWQINMLGELGVQRREQFHLTSNEDLYDLKVNASAMAAISSMGTNWKPWSAYGGARYALAYPASVATASAVLAGKGLQKEVDTTVGAITTVTDAATTAAGSLAKTAAWLSNRNNWFRIAKVSVGIGLVLTGTLMLARPVETLARINRNVKGIVPI